MVWSSRISSLYVNPSICSKVQSQMSDRYCYKQHFQPSLLHDQTLSKKYQMSSLQLKVLFTLSLSIWTPSHALEKLVTLLGMNFKVVMFLVLVLVGCRPVGAAETTKASLVDFIRAEITHENSGQFFALNWLYSNFLSYFSSHVHCYISNKFVIYCYSNKHGKLLMLIKSICYISNKLVIYCYSNNHGNLSMLIKSFCYISFLLVQRIKIIYILPKNMTLHSLYVLAPDVEPIQAPKMILPAQDIPTSSVSLY